MSSASDPPNNSRALRAPRLVAEDLAREHAWLLRLTRRLVGSSGDAEDLAQETLRVALQKRARGSAVPNGESDHQGLRRWLGAAARRAALGRWRSDASRRYREEESAPHEALPSAASAVAKAEARRALADAVLALEARFRDAVLLRYFEGLRYEEVARQLGTSPVAARQRVSRGVAALRATLGAIDGHDSIDWLSGVLLATPALKFPSTMRPPGTTVLVMHGKLKWAIAAALALVGSLALRSWYFAPAGAEPVSGVTDVKLVRATLQTPDERLALATEDRSRTEALEMEPVTMEAEAISSPVTMGTPAELQVHVVNAEGEPITHATVTVARDWVAGFSSSGFHSFASAPLVAATSVESPGLYSAQVVEERVYQVFVEAEGYGRAQYLACFAGTTVQAVLRPGASFSGTVFSAVDGAVLPRAMVRVFHGQDEVHVDRLTDGAGRFHFGGLTAGAGAFFVSPQGHIQTRYAEVEFRPGEDLVRQIAVERGWTLTGQVRDAATSAPIAAAELSVWSFQAHVERSDINGYYAIEGLGSRSSSLHVRARGYATARVAFDDPSEAFDVALHPGCSVVGRLVDTSGNSLADGYVGQIRWGADYVDPARVHGDGAFRIEDVDPRHSLTLLPRVLGFEATPVTMDLAMWRPDATGVIDVGELLLERGAVISGRVKWSSGGAVNTGRVYIGRANVDGEGAGQERHAFCNDEGSFRIVELAPGRWHARLLVPGQPQRVESFELAPGQHLSDIEWTVTDGDGGSIQGRVVDGEGAPVWKACVHLANERERDDVSNVTRTDREGAFQFGHLSRDSYSVHVSVDRFSVQAREREESLLPRAMVGVTPGENFLEVRLLAGVPAAVSVRSLAPSK